MKKIRRKSSWATVALLFIFCLVILLLTCERLPISELAEGVGFWDMTAFDHSSFAP